MTEISISKLKTSCTAAVARVNASRQPIVITRRGKPVAVLAPYSSPAKKRSALGYMAGTGRILSDIVDERSDELERLEVGET